MNKRSSRLGVLLCAALSAVSSASASSSYPAIVVKGSGVSHYDPKRMFPELAMKNWAGHDVPGRLGQLAAQGFLSSERI
jgi:hypothetical protein